MISNANYAKSHVMSSGPFPHDAAQVIFINIFYWPRQSSLEFCVRIFREELIFPGQEAASRYQSSLATIESAAKSSFALVKQSLELIIEE